MFMLSISATVFFLNYYSFLPVKREARSSLLSVCTVVSHTGINHIQCFVLQYNNMMLWPVTRVHVAHANVSSWTDHILQL